MCFASSAGSVGTAGASTGGSLLTGVAQLAPSLISAGTQAYTASNTASAQQSVLNYQSGVTNANAELAELRAQDATRQGVLSEMDLRSRVKQVKGQQRAAFAANGVALNEGSPVQVAASTDWVRDVDIATIRNNAARSAFGYRTQGANATAQARGYAAGAGTINPSQSAITSLLGSAGSISQKWYDIYKNGGFGTSAPAVDTTTGGEGFGSSLFSSSGF
jgi:hypothetical protein